jgi:hypothetical protein
MSCWLDEIFLIRISRATVATRQRESILFHVRQGQLVNNEILTPKLSWVKYDLALK